MCQLFKNIYNNFRKNNNMNSTSNYQKILEHIFSEPVNLGKNTNINNCTGALLKEDYYIFKKNFIERLQRLKEYYKEDREQLNQIKSIAINIAQKSGYKWSGAYSELVALDFWIRFQELQDIKFINQYKVDYFHSSIAKQIGKQTIDIDISFTLQCTKIFMDVKSYIPTHYEITDRIIELVQKKEKYNNVFIGLENLDGGNYLETKKYLVQEIKNSAIITNIQLAIDQKQRQYRHKLNNGNEYLFRIEYPNEDGQILLITIDFLEPYRQANNNKYKFIEYYNKLLIDVPSYLLFVRNTWWDRELNNSIDFQKTYYRAVTRRVFMELTKDNTRAEEIFEDIPNSNLTISYIAQKITGIIFIEDNSILKTGKDLYKTYIYLNPNATNKKMNRNDFEILQWTSNAIQPDVIEDFEYDNY
jgi:hypothetical protein